MLETEFERRLHAEHTGADTQEAEARRLVQAWHRYPSLHNALWFHGINLGEMDEPALLPAVLHTLIAHSRRQSS